MDRNRTGDGSAREAEWALRDKARGITSDHIARAARELVAAYGPAARDLMRKRTRAVRRRGDSESALLWFAIAQAIEEQLGARAASGREASFGD